jgi:hypothetical protein
MLTAKALLMIRPAHFGYNSETAVTNAFQQLSTKQHTAQLALDEFNQLVNQFAKNNIPLELIEDTISPSKPDAIFPNNWFSTHANGKIILYPMCTPNRRNERRSDLIHFLQKKYQYHTIHDLSHYEKQGQFLEGTGSIVFDHHHQLVYAALSERTQTEPLLDLCGILGYLPIVFSTSDQVGKPIYHTNVMMALQEKLALVCFDCIHLPEERRTLRRILEITGKTILEISYDQMCSFAGNMLFVQTTTSKSFCLLSETAWNCLLPQQKSLLSQFAEPIYSPIPTIETVGGGSVRCMLAELF